MKRINPKRLKMSSWTHTTIVCHYVSTSLLPRSSQSLRRRNPPSVPAQCRCSWWRWPRRAPAYSLPSRQENNSHPAPSGECLQLSQVGTSGTLWIWRSGNISDHTTRIFIYQLQNFHEEESRLYICDWDSHLIQTAPLLDLTKSWVTFLSIDIVVRGLNSKICSW